MASLPCCGPAPRRPVSVSIGSIVRRERILRQRRPRSNLALGTRVPRPSVCRHPMRVGSAVRVAAVVQPRTRKALQNVEIRIEKDKEPVRMLVASVGCLPESAVTFSSQRRHCTPGLPRPLGQIHATFLTLQRRLVGGDNIELTRVGGSGPSFRCSPGRHSRGAGWRRGHVV